ncbi:ATP-binding cassette domain-containing protein [Acuticoccus sp. 2012]|uniref:Glutathione import ATP-binding protein GsiA n=2 Tax=Acuticoccus mangrovi TaxID=2796142 RepID=A0A934IQV5_9HYPH|nr:ATP-binding cassette domain-containing protein [Acuticoccus mangrovi]
MRRGEVLEQGSVEQVFNEPQHAYTKLLIQAVPRLGDMTGSATPRRFGRGAGEAATVPLTAPPSPTVPTSAAPSPRVPTSAAPSPTVPTAAAPSAGVPASSAPSPAVPASAVPVPAAPAEAKPHLGKARPVLEVRNLVTRFAVRGGPLRRHVGNVHAVENVSFSIAPGETLSLVGESGSGKSTTGRTILGLEQAQSGEILLDGYEVRPSTRRGIRELRSSIQMIFQDPFGSLDPRQRIGSAVAEPVISRGLASRAEASRKVDHLLRRVGLDPAVRTRYPHEFSGGQRQRICIARALAVDPRLVIADEAVSALDASVKAQVVDLMIDLQEEFGLAYLFISHDMAVVERISHRIAVMYMGEIVEIGSRADILERPRHAYTRRLLDAVPVPNPEHRRKRLPAPEGELPSPIRPVGAHRPQTRMVEVAPGHFVLRTLEEIADEPLPQIEPVPSVDDALADEMMRFGRA